jgi:hypothetical protein
MDKVYDHVFLFITNDDERPDGRNRCQEIKKRYQPILKRTTILCDDDDFLQHYYNNCPTVAYCAPVTDRDPQMLQLFTTRRFRKHSNTT